VAKRTRCRLIPARILSGRKTWYTHMASLEEVGTDPMADLLFNEVEDCTTEMLLERNLNCVSAWSG